MASCSHTMKKMVVKDNRFCDIAICNIAKQITKSLYRKSKGSEFNDITFRCSMQSYEH